VCRSRRPRCISCLPTPPSFRSFRGQVDPNASQKIMRRSTPLFQTTFGVRCAINTSSHPPPRYPSTDSRAGGGDIGKRLHRGKSARDSPDANTRAPRGLLHRRGSRLATQTGRSPANPGVRSAAHRGLAPQGNRTEK